MGLFDFMNTGDPEKDSMIREGLLQFGLGLMSSRGRTLPAIGNAGRQSLSAMDAYKQRQMQAKLFGQQQEEFKRKQLGWAQQDVLDKLPAQYMKPAQPGGVDATGGIETDTMASNNATPAGMDYKGLAQALMAAPGGFKEGLALQGQLRKDAPTIHSLGASGGAYVDSNGQLVRIPGNPQQHADSPDIQALALLYGKGTPEFNKALKSMMDKKNHIVPQGFNRDENGNLTVDPTWLDTQLKIRRAGPEASAAARQNVPAEAKLAPEDLSFMAQQYMAGDKSVLQNLGRGAQGAQNIVALRGEIRRQMEAQGLNGSQMAAKLAEYAGLTAAQRTVGTRTANIEVASTEAEKVIPLAAEASSNVARSGFLPFGKAQIMFNEQTNNPELRKFAAANNALVNIYARAIAPTGVPTVHDKEHAREVLATAHDHASYMATLDQMRKEIAAARAAPKEVRQSFTDAISGDKSGGKKSNVIKFDAQGNMVQ